MERRNFFQLLFGGATAGLGAKIASLLPVPKDAVITQTVVENVTPLAEMMKSDMLYDLLSNSTGRQRLAHSLGPSLARRRDYMSLVRKAFRVVDGDRVSSLNHHDLYYFRDYVTTQKIYPACGYNLCIPTSEISSNPMFPIQHLQERRFDLFARDLNIAKAEVGATEDSRMFALIDAVSDDDVKFGPSFIAETRSKFSKRGVDEIQYIFANPKDVSMILKLGDKLRYVPNCDKHLQKTGLLGYVEDASLYLGRMVSEGYIYITGGTDAKTSMPGADDAVCAGYVADKLKLTVLSADHPPSHIGFSIFEESGFAVNPIAVQRVPMKKTS